MIEDDLSYVIINAAIEVHKTLGGSGLLESVYEECLCEELVRRGLEVKRQIAIPINYKNKILQTHLRLDLIVSDKVIVECKAVEKYNPIFESQALTYLRLSNLKLALILNFGEKFLKNGIQRVVNNL